MAFSSEFPPPAAVKATNDPKTVVSQSGGGDDTPARCDNVVVETNHINQPGESVDNMVQIAQCYSIDEELPLPGFVGTSAADTTVLLTVDGDDTAEGNAQLLGGGPSGEIIFEANDVEPLTETEQSAESGSDSEKSKPFWQAPLTTVFNAVGSASKAFGDFVEDNEDSVIAGHFIIEFGGMAALTRGGSVMAFSAEAQAEAVDYLEEQGITLEEYRESNSVPWMEPPGVTQIMIGARIKHQEVLEEQRAAASGYQQYGEFMTRHADDFNAILQLHKAIIGLPNSLDYYVAQDHQADLQAQESQIPTEETCEEMTMEDDEFLTQPPPSN
jgi:hypothetical protein